MACCEQYLLELFRKEEDQGQSGKEMTKNWQKKSNVGNTAQRQGDGGI
jgi:hypothetical protein